MRKGEDANNEVASDNLNKKKKGIPKKIHRYFPLIPRLQRLFMTKGTAKEMRWHKDNRVDDGVLRHPADSLAWKSFDEKHPNFASDPRSVRLGLASDGFNPFGSMSNSYSMWLVILIPYNLPPWVCMKQSNLLLSLLIPGPKGLGMNIDVYLQPLIDDLKTLWGDGIETYDAFMKHNFQLRASLLWTINNFPAYGILFGWSTKELSVEKLDQLDKSIRITLCKLERVFLPTFFDVMVHLAIHLANEVKLGGPAQFRWMYYIERYILNDFRFRTMESELGLKTQNSGVIVKSDEHTGNVDYFGKIRRILEIQYMNNKSIILFQCDWFEVPPQGRSQSRGSQAQSVYYVKQGQSEKWHAVIRVRPRNLYDFPEQQIDEMEPYHLIDLVERGEANTHVELENENIIIQREDIDGVSVEAPSHNNEEEEELVVVDESDHENVDDFSDSATDEATSEYDGVEDDD
ncbi:hypothetical protein MTR67_052832 [Solanum verrucosum]|uniref:DUF4218 domain-containing protein n=1 Tax=Solanum verrucosum TaxID=315347 RepID=A0AAF1A098_SOLVR|nr:hypothetical protein MTR67_052832 [Solanum verrucosum]